MASLPYPRRPLNNSPTDFTDAHRWLGCVGFSHRIHGTHRSFWRRIASHGIHRCSQMVRLRRVLWEDSLVAAWVWQGCHTLLICAHLCNLWENILRHKLLWILWLLWEDIFVGAWGSPTEFTEFTEVSGVEEPPTDFTDAHRWLGCVGFCGKIVWWVRGYGRDAIPSYSLLCLLCWCTSCSGKRQSRAEASAPP